MKKLSLVALMLLTFNASAATFNCAKEGSILRPANADAKKLADKLKVTTCRGKTFKAVVAKLKQKVSVVPSTAISKTYAQAVKGKAELRVNDAVSLFQ